MFVADPAWGARERAQFAALVARADEAPLAGGLGWLCIPTGGSSGNLKLARHDEQTLAAAVAGFCAHFGVERVNALGLLPLHHVSGLMAWMRCALTGGRYVHADWKAIERGELYPLPHDIGGGWFLSLVPTQLQRLLGSAAAVEWLRGFRAVFVGGGPSWPALIEAGAAAGVPLAFSYGLTETAAMVTALRPEEFAAGERGAGRALPHARIVLDGGGGIGVVASSLFRGYWPGWRSGEMWLTGDVGVLDAEGRLQVAGRGDALIITGGEKVNPLEVEAALRESGLFADVVVLGVPDREWGESVVAFYSEELGGGGGMGLVERVAARLEGRLAGFKRPRRFVRVSPWPRNAQGKVNREALKRLAG